MDEAYQRALDARLMGISGAIEILFAGVFPRDELEQLLAGDMQLAEERAIAQPLPHLQPWLVFIQRARLLERALWLGDDPRSPQSPRVDALEERLRAGRR